jgi:uroporphyrinogen decarboxylase
MTRRERVLAAIEGEQTDIIPYQIDVTSGFALKLREKTGCDDVEEYLGNHLSKAKYKKNRKLKDGKELDLFGVTWMQDPAHGDVGIICDHPIKNPSLAHYTFPAVRRDFALNLCKELEIDSKDTFKMFLITMNYYERAWSLRGMENILTDMVMHAAFVEELFERILHHHLELLDAVLDYDFDAVYIGDDWGQQKGLIMGPPLWRKFIKPGMSKMFERIKESGKYVCLHSCGDIRDILPDLVDMGLDIYNTIQPEIYNLSTLKREYGKYMTFYGGISTQQFLPYASADEVGELTREVKDIMGKNGGYILAPTHSVTDDIPVDNVMAMVKVAQEQNV